MNGAQIVNEWTLILLPLVLQPLLTTTTPTTTPTTPACLLYNEDLVVELLSLQHGVEQVQQYAQVFLPIPEGDNQGDAVPGEAVGGVPRPPRPHVPQLQLQGANLQRLQCGHIHATHWGGSKINRAQKRILGGVLLD